MPSRYVLGFVGALAAFGAVGCRQRHPENVLAVDTSIGFGLGASEPDDRRRAAIKVRSDDQLAAAVPHLLRAIEREIDEDAKYEMLISLGISGAAEAKPVLEANLTDPDKTVRKGAEKGLDRWGKKTGKSTSAVAKLQSADAGARRDAAIALAEHDGPPPESVAPLVTAATRESDPRALQAMLLTLGASGSPDAKPVLDAHVADANADTQRAAQKAVKKWRAKNGQAVRKDVETSTATAATAAAASAATATPAKTDGCGQFKTICGADPFNVDACRSDLKALSYPQQEVWADCVNASSASCQQAHAACLPKARSAK